MTEKKRLLDGTTSAFFYSGISSTLSSLALRSAAMTFNVYLSGIAGAGAMGLLSLIYSVWGFALTLGCVSGGFLSSRIYASEVSLGGSTKKGSSMCLRFTFICGGIIGASLFLLSDIISLYLLGDTRCALPLRMLSVSLPFISASGSIEGYFNACTRSYKTAAMRLIEQVIRVSVTVSIFFFVGHKNDAEACINIILGGVLTEILSFILLYILYLYDRKAHFSKNDSHAVSSYKDLASLSIPLTLSTGIRSGLVSLEHVMIPKGLIANGTEYSKALSVFGTVHGMALPVVLFCYAVPSSFSALLIPKIAEYNARKNKREIVYIAGRAYRLALCFSLAVSAFILLSSGLLGNILYPGSDAGKYIYLLSPLIPIMYIDSVSDSFLKGLNRQAYSMRINIADSLISLFCVVFLMPHMGITGYIIAIYASEIFNTCMSLQKVMRITGYSIPVLRAFVTPLICSVLSAKITGSLYSVGGGILESIFLFIIGILLFTALYFLLLFSLKNITHDERKWVISLLKPARKEK